MNTTFLVASLGAIVLIIVIAIFTGTVGRIAQRFAIGKPCVAAGLDDALIDHFRDEPTVSRAEAHQLVEAVNAMSDTPFPPETKALLNIISRLATTVAEGA